MIARIYKAAALLAVSLPLIAEPITQSPTFQDLSGKPHTFTELRGHPAVINFWATWCGPCKEEMPRLQKLSESFAPQNITFIAVSLDAPETRSKIDSVIQKRNFHLPIWTGATDATLTQLNLGVLVPATLILDSDGEIIGKIEGEASDKDVRSRLTWALNGHQGKQPKVIQKNDW